MAAWRRMSITDTPDVQRIADEIHPELQGSKYVFGPYLGVRDWTAPFWARFRFTTEPADEGLSEKLSVYGVDAAYLTRKNG